EDNAFSLRQDLPYLGPAADALEKAVAAGEGPGVREALERMVQQIDAWPRPQPQRVRRYMQRLLQRLVYAYGGERAQALAEKATAALSACQSLPALADAAQRIVRELLPKREDIGEAVALCMEALQQDPASPISLEEVARRYGVDPMALDEGIRACTDLSFLLYQRQLRVAKAQGLFEDTDLPIAAIAEQVGYPDPAHFARVYQKVAGKLPPR
nr:helix-turn-helix domain-containing protein [Clostridia bacterium]